MTMKQEVMTMPRIEREQFTIKNRGLSGERDINTVEEGY